jgi:hypothetical protein
MLVAPMPPWPTPNVESPQTLYVPYKSHTSVQRSDLMKFTCQNHSPMKCLTLSVATNNIGQYFSVRMDYKGH